MKLNEFGFALAFFSTIATFVALFAAWVTHVIYCLASASYLLLIAGGLVVPVGVIHGFSVWFGMGW